MKVLMFLSDKEKSTLLFSQMLQDILAIKNIEVKKTILEKVQEIEKENPDVVLIIFIYPYVFSFDEAKEIFSQQLIVIKKIRESCQFKKIPVLIVGNYSEKEIEEMGLPLQIYYSMGTHSPFKILEKIESLKAMK